MGDDGCLPIVVNLYYQNIQFSTMGKDNTKNLVGQPILNKNTILPRAQFDLLIK